VPAATTLCLQKAMFWSRAAAVLSSARDYTTWRFISELLDLRPLSRMKLPRAHRTVSTLALLGAREPKVSRTSVMKGGFTRPFAEQMATALLAVAS